MSLIERYRPVWSPEGAGSGAAPSGASGGGTPSGGSPASGSSSVSPAPSSAPASSSSSGSVSPSPSPASAGETPVSAPDGAASFDFGALFGDESPLSPALVGEAPAAAVAPPSSPTPVPPAGVAAPAPEPVQGEVAAAAQPAAQGVSEAVPSPAAAPQLDPYDPAMLASHLAASEPQAVDFVAQNMFQLSQPEIEAIEQDVIGAIPKLLAKVFVKSQQNVLSQLGRMIPVMVQRHTEAMTRNATNQDKFYASWPMIDRTQHGNLVNQYATVYRQMHPNATLDQLIGDLGPMVMMAARIPPTAAVPGQPAGRLAATAASNGRSPQPSPFVPAGGQAGAASQSKARELTPWEAMFTQSE